MEIFLTSISGILVILGMILVGFVMGEKGWFDDKSRGLIAKMVTQIALPCYMLYTTHQKSSFLQIYQNAACITCESYCVPRTVFRLTEERTLYAFSTHP